MIFLLMLVLDLYFDIGLFLDFFSTFFFLRAFQNDFLQIVVVDRARFGKVLYDAWSRLVLSILENLCDHVEHESLEPWLAQAECVLVALHNEWLVRRL